jgi:hypothetical protein
MLIVVVFFFLELAQRACFLFNLGLWGFCESHGVSELKLLFNMMLGYMYQLLDEHDMWRLVEKNPKEMGVLEKHNTKVSLWELKKIVKIMFFSIGTVST